MHVSGTMSNNLSCEAFDLAALLGLNVQWGIGTFDWDRTYIRLDWLYSAVCANKPIAVKKHGITGSLAIEIISRDPLIAWSGTNSGIAGNAFFDEYAQNSPEAGCWTLVQSGIILCLKRVQYNWCTSGLPRIHFGAHTRRSTTYQEMTKVHKEHKWRDRSNR